MNAQIYLRFNEFLFRWNIRFTAIVSICLILGVINARAQVATQYTFSQANETYTAITGGTAIAVATNHTTSADVSLDQGNYSFAIPFSFNFNGTAYTAGNANANGYITFGATLPATSLTTPISTNTAYNGVVSAMARDLWGVYGSVGTRTSGSAVITAVTDFTGIAIGKPIRGTGIATGATITAFDIALGTITMSAVATSTSSTYIGWPVGEIRVETTGVAPNRVCVIQYSGFADFAVTAPTGHIMSWQFQLYEGGGLPSGQIIKIVYGPQTNLSTTSRTQQVGLRGATNADFNNRTATTTWSGTTAGASNSATVTRTNTIFPASGLAFIWSPPSVCSGTPTAGTASTSTTNLCYNSTATFSLSGYTSGVSGIDLQWQSSPTAGGPYTNVTTGTGATTSNFISGPVTANTYFRCLVTCSGSGISANSNEILISINNPQVTSVLGGSRCGTGTVNLSATSSGGNVLTWYAAATGGSPLGTGTSFTTPVISTNTTFYVAATQGVPAATVGLSPTSTSCGTMTATTALDWPIRFNTTSSVTINTVDVIPNAAGSYTFALRNALSSTNLQSATFSFTAAQVGIPQTVSLGFNITTPGNYQLTNTAGGGYRIGTYTCSYPYTSPSGNFSIVGSATSSTLATNTTTYNIFYNINISEGCEGSREPVLASIVPSATISASTDMSIICNGGSANLSVTSSNANYTYTWTPGNMTGSNITVSPTASTTYTVNGVDNSGCANVSTVTVDVLPSPITIASVATDICVSGSRTLSLSPASGYPAGTIQWQSSPDGITWTNIGGAVTSTFTTPVLTTTTHYRAQISNSSAVICTNPSVVLTVNNPTIVSTLAGSRCGIGTVNLSATGSAGTTLNWYDVPTGGIPIGTGTTFTTPVISGTTNFYVAPASGSTNGIAGRITPFNTSTGFNGNDYGLVFDVTQAFTLYSVDVYPTSSAGSITIELENGAGVVVATTGPVAVPAGTGTTYGTGATPFTIPLNFNITPGTNYRLQSASQTLNLVRDNPIGAVFSYPLPIGSVGTLTAGLLGGSANANTYYYFYNLSFQSGCEGSRTTVIASVVSAPPITASTNLSSICNGSSANLSVTSSNANYTYTWSPGGQTGASISVSPATTTTYTVNAADNSGCADQATVILNVIPASVSITAPAGDICVSGTRTLTLNPSTGYPAGSIEWQNSPDGIIWNTIAGANSSSYTTPTLVSTTHYRVLLKNSDGVVCLQPTHIVTVNNPSVLSVAPDSRCGAGTVTLGATAPVGSTLNWYAAATGGAPLGTGSTFTTPIISANTNFYVAAAAAPTSVSVGMSPTNNSCGTIAVTSLTDWPLRFNTLSAVTINTVDIIPNIAGSYTIALRNSLSSTNIQTANFTFTAAQVGIPQTINLGFTVSGAGNYQLTNVAGGGYRIGTFTCAYPFTSPSGNFSIVGSATTSTSATNTTTYNIFYNVNISETCESGRTAVLASVTSSTPITATSVLATVCQGNSTDVAVNSSNPNYSYTWTSTPAGYTATGPGPHSVTPTGSGTTYQVYGFDAGTQCGAVASITVNATPNAIGLTATSTPASVCYDGDAQLQATATIPGYTMGSNCGSGFIDISTTGTSIGSVTDDSQFNVTMPSFTFNGVPYTSLRIGSNGVIVFGSTTGAITLTNAALPATTVAAGNVFLAPFWDDLDINSGGTIKTQTVGSRFIIQYTGLDHNLFTTGVITFQVQLELSTGVVRFIYPDAEFGNVTHDFGATATVGIQFSTTSAIQYSFNTASLSNGQCISFSPSTSTFTYDWSANSTYLNNTGVANPIAQGVQSSEVYSITVTDNSTGCVKTSTVNLNVLPLPVPSAFTNAPVCENSDILLFASDGTAYTWTGPNSYSSTSTIGDATIYGAQQINSGNYTVNVTGANGCTNSETIYVQVNDNPEPFIASSSEVSCTGFSDGTFQVGVNGGTPFFSFNEQTQGQNFSGFYGGLAAGTYTVDVTDLNQCVSQFPLLVTVTSVPNAAPVISCPANISVNSTPGLCGAIVNYPTPVGSDVCPILGTAQTAGLASGWTFPVGTTVNTFEVTDVEGVKTSCSFNVTVAENQPPTITNCPANFAACNPVTWTPPTITDNCPGVVVTSTAVPGTNFGPGTTTVTYTATDAYNNVSTCSFQVTRYEESIAPTGITSDRDFNNICVGESINLTINGGSVGQGSQWKWYTGSCAGTPLPAFNGMSTISVSPAATTTYFARAEGLCNITACVSITVVVSTTGPANGILAITNMPPFGAPGVTGTIDVTPVPGATFYRWSSINGHINAVWFPTGPGPVDTNVPSVNVLFNQSLSNYQIRVVAGNACGRTNNVSAHIRGTVPASTCLNGPALACPNTTATYSVASCPIPGTNSYQWAVTGNATITAGQGTPTITVSFGAGFTTGTVCVNGITNFGLAGPQTCLTISNNTAAPGPIAGNNQPCQGGNEIYTITPVAGATSYLWTTNIAGATASGTTTSGSVQFPAGPFSGNVCVQAISSCGTSIASGFSVTSGVAGVPGPILGPVSGICGAIGNYALSTNDANSYNWILPSGVTFASPNGSNSIQLQFPAAPGSYVITVEAFYDCGSATSTITVNGAPGTPTVTPATICAGGTDETYIASAAGADSYNWTTSGTIYEQCTNPNCSNFYIIWDIPGGSFSVTAQNACGVSAVPFSLSTNCRITEGGQMETKVYPNPTTGLLTIEFTSYAGGNYNIMVTDMSGRMVQTDDVKATSGHNQHQLNLESANPGMYMLYIKDGEGKISVTKVTKE